jgi:hypothetical protein
MCLSIWNTYKEIVMKGQIVESGQPIRKEDLENAYKSLEAGLRERFHDQLKYGVVKNSQMDGEDIPFKIQLGSDLHHIKIGSGIAYGPYDSSSTPNDWPIPSVDISDTLPYKQNPTPMDRIVISASDKAIAYARSSFDKTGIYHETFNNTSNVSTPQSSGTLDIPIEEVEDTYYVWLGYLSAIDDSVWSIHKTSGNRLFYKRIDGYDVVVTNSSTAPEDRFFLIGTVPVNSSGEIVFGSIDQSAMPYMSFRNIELEDIQGITGLTGDIAQLQADVDALEVATVGTSKLEDNAVTLDKIGTDVVLDRIRWHIPGNLVVTGDAVSVRSDIVGISGKISKIFIKMQGLTVDAGITVKLNGSNILLTSLLAGNPTHTEVLSASVSYGDVVSFHVTALSGAESNCDNTYVIVEMTK